MPNIGGHSYHTFQRNGQTFKITFGDCEYRQSNRFINTLTDSNIENLFESIYNNIWLQNVYAVQDKRYDSYLIGQTSTQDFINATSQNTTFWGLVPFDLIVLANVSFYPYSCGNCRWNIEIDFGSATEFKYQNYDPNATQPNPSNVPNNTSTSS